MLFPKAEYESVIEKSFNVINLWRSKVTKRVSLENAFA